MIPIPKLTGRIKILIKMAKSMFEEFGHEMANSWVPTGKKENFSETEMAKTAVSAEITHNDWVNPEGKNVHFINVVITFKNGSRKSFKLSERDGQPQYAAGTKIDLDSIQLQGIMDLDGKQDARAYCKAI